MRPIKISIVTPSYNQAGFLEDTIKSVLSQNYPNLEYIIIDGGSTDGSLEIIEKYSDRLHFWCSEPDLGHYDAINKGFRKSTGEVMGWLNSDDLYFSFCLKTINSIFSELPPVNWLTTSRAACWDFYGFCTDIATYKGFSKEAFLDGRYLPFPGRHHKSGYRFIQQESTFWRRNLWQRAGATIATEFDLAGDFDLWRRFYMHDDLHGVSSPLGGFRARQGQRSENIEKYCLQAQRSLLTMRQDFGWSPLNMRGLARTLTGERLKYPFGYSGKRLVRAKANLPEGCWQIEKYSFL